MVFSTLFYCNPSELTAYSSADLVVLGAPMMSLAARFWTLSSLSISLQVLGDKATSLREAGRVLYMAF